MTALFLAIGYLIGGAGRHGDRARSSPVGMNLFAYWNADKMVLRMYGARQVDARRRRSSTAWSSSSRRGPACRCPRSTSSRTTSPTPSPPAATRRTPRSPRPPACCSMLSREEVAGVMAHELAHVKNRDTLIMTVTATIAGAIVDAGQFRVLLRRQRRQPQQPAGHASARSLMVFLAPLAAMLVQMAISRSREYEADRIGAEICGRPLCAGHRAGEDPGGAARIDNVQAETQSGDRASCSSSTRCIPARSTGCSAPIPRPRSGCGGCARWPVPPPVRRCRGFHGRRAAGALGPVIGPAMVSRPAPAFRTGRPPATSRGSGAGGRSAGPGCRRRRPGRPA